MNVFRTSHPAVRIGAAVALALVAGISPASAVIVDNFPLKVEVSTSSDPKVVGYELPRLDNGYYNSSNEYGAVAILQPGVPNVLRSIELPYFSDYSAADALTVRLYRNDGSVIVQGHRSPGTLLDELTVNIATSGGGAVTTYTANYAFNALNVLPLPSGNPNEFTVTVQFAGLGGGNNAGWLISSSDVTTGSHYNLFWEKVGGDWTAKTFAVPEPNSALIAGALLGAVAIARRYLKARS